MRGEQLGRAPKEVEKRREPLSNAELGGLLAGIGNHEGKSLLLASMHPDTPYTSTQVHNLTSRDGVKYWNHAVPFEWCGRSLAPIGMVTKEIIDPQKGIVGYEISEKGKELGVALAGHLLAFSERHPEVSLSDLLGASHTPIKDTDENDEHKAKYNKNRAPITRFRMYLEIVTADLPIRKDDLVNALRDNYPGEYDSTGLKTMASKHLDNLATAGLVTYKKVDVDHPYVKYKRTAEKHVSDAKQVDTPISLADRVHAFVTQSEGTFTIPDIFDHLIHIYPEYLDHSEAALLHDIGKHTKALSKSGSCTSVGEFQYGTLSSITLTDVQRNVLSDFVSIIDAFQGNDPEFLEDGRKKAQAIVSDTSRFQALMGKARAHSKKTNAKDRAETGATIVSFLRENPRATSREIRDYLAKYGQTYTIKNVLLIVGVLEQSGHLAREVEGNKVTFSLSEGTDDESTPQPPEDTRAIPVAVYKRYIHAIPEESPADREIFTRYGIEYIPGNTNKQQPLDYPEIGE